MLEDTSGKDVEKSPTEQNESANPPPTPGSSGAVPVQAAANQSEKTLIEQIEARVRRAEIWMICLTGAIAFFGLWAVNVGIQQRRATRGQSNERQVGRADIHNFGIADETQAGVANQNTQIDQRPWMNIFVGQTVLNDKNPLIVPIRITNTGKTPAYNLHGIAVVNLLGRNDQPDFSYGSEIHPEYSFDTSTAAPNSPTDLQWAALPTYVAKDKPIVPILVTDAIRKGLQEGSLSIAVYGRITYSDVFGANHWTNFCSYAQTPGAVSQRAAVDTCGHYNDVDKNYQKMTQ